MELNPIRTKIASLLLNITLLIGMIAIMPICDANLAFMANNNNPLGIEVETTFGTVDVPVAGHVGFGYQKDDGTFVFGSFGPSPGNLPLWAPGTLTIETFDDWAAVERYLITNYYTTYKLFSVDNPNQQGAWDTMERFKDSYYNLLTSVVDIKNSPLAGLAGTNSEHPDSENCLTFSKKVLEVYGVENLPPIVPFITSAPNNYFLSIPGEIHSTISDIEQESQVGVHSTDSQYVDHEAVSQVTQSPSSTDLEARIELIITKIFDSLLKYWNNYWVKHWVDEGNVLLYSKNDFYGAIQNYDMAIAIDPHTSAAWFNKGIAYQSLGQNDQARQAYDEAIEIEPYLVTHIPKAAELGYNTQVSEYYKTIKRRS